MSAAFKGSGEEGIRDGKCFFRGDETCGKRQHVGIVVLTRQARHISTPCDRRAHTAMFVGGDVHPVGTTADDDPERDTTIAHCLCYSVGMIRVINTFERICPFINNVPTLLVQVLEDLLLQLIPCMISSDGDEGVDLP